MLAEGDPRSLAKLYGPKFQQSSAVTAVAINIDKRVQTQERGKAKRRPTPSNTVYVGTNCGYPASKRPTFNMQLTPLETGLRLTRSKQTGGSRGRFVGEES